ncbi:MAG: peptide chain release factor 1 [Clostridia bacterium]|nr:peptide chain release factor 1 [Clostridia bacterium]MBR0444428.1 peptide chain release factor 1 [Clostridia bacterium]
MLDKLKRISDRYDQLTEQMAAPDAMNDRDAWREMVKEHSSLEEIVSAYHAYEETQTSLKDCRDMLSDHLDPEMKELVREEIAELEQKSSEQEEALKALLAPKDPNDDKNVILEIRAGTGGDEAALFGADLLRMYLRYAERQGYQVETIDSNVTEMGGVKEMVLSFAGRRGVYSRLKYESGVHRVQRVPETESQGRIHTSAATVAVLPEVDDIQVEINESDIRIDLYHSSGAGGQHVNKTESAIRITHLPTGIVVQCQDERSQLKNKEKAMRVLKSRLYDYYQSKQEEALISTRRSMVGSGDRSERIRTYNFPQNRVTDHRIGLTLYKLEQFLDGDMDEMIDALVLAERTEKLSSGED